MVCDLKCLYFILLQQQLKMFFILFFYDFYWIHFLWKLRYLLNFMSAILKKGLVTVSRGLVIRGRGFVTGGRGLVTKAEKVP